MPLSPIWTAAIALGAIGAVLLVVGGVLYYLAEAAALTAVTDTSADQQASDALQAYQLGVAGITLMSLGGACVLVALVLLIAALSMRAPLRRR
jgi:hypothetical protein